MGGAGRCGVEQEYQGEREESGPSASDCASASSRSGRQSGFSRTRPRCCSPWRSRSSYAPGCSPGEPSLCDPLSLQARRTVTASPGPRGRNMCDRELLDTLALPGSARARGILRCPSFARLGRARPGARHAALGCLHRQSGAGLGGDRSRRGCPAGRVSRLGALPHHPGSPTPALAGTHDRTAGNRGRRPDGRLGPRPRHLVRVRDHSAGAAAGRSRRAGGDSRPRVVRVGQR
ncbi:hypothetical protein SALBM311S_10701 [Streptomyces alboniger]